MSFGNLALAIDLGTGGPKVALVDANGNVVAHAFEPNTMELLPGGGAEQDPHAWWSAIGTASRRVMAQAGVSPEDVVAVCATTQWSGTVAVDRAGAPLMNAISWMDSRGEPHVRAMARGLVNIDGYGVSKVARWIRLTGGAPGLSGKDPVAHIAWLRAERPEVFEATYKFLEPKDYINLRLTGEFAAGFDSIALHWVTDNRDAGDVRYHDGLLALAGIPRDKLPDLRPATDILGPLTAEAAAHLGVADGIAVVMGTPDIHGAAIGSGGVVDYDAHVYIGTSSWLVCHVPFKKTDLLHSMASLPAAIPGRYLLLNEQETAGACLNFLRDNLLFPKDELTPDGAPDEFYGALDRLAGQASPGSGGLLFLPWLYGERTPVEDANVRGGFFNMSLSTTRPEMLRAVLEGVALNSRWLLGYVESFVGRKLEAIRMVGGGAKSDLWCQIYADVLGRPILQVDGPIEAGARGAGILAFVGLGRLTFEEVAKRVKIKQRYEPKPDAAAGYDQAFAAFTEIYRNNKKMFARLNRRS